MIPLRPPPPPALARPLEAVAEQARERGSPAPPWIVVEDEEGEWYPLLAGAAPAERARVVAALSTDAALVQARRLGVGGALWLPPSTPSMENAFSAAALRPPPPAGYDLSALEACLAPEQGVVAVTAANRGFWRVQLGDCRIAALLAALAERLSAMPTLLSWPAIVIPERDPEQVQEAWRALEQDPMAPAEGLLVARIPPADRAVGLAAAATTALAAAEQQARRGAAVPARPVCELPSGRLVGRWCPSGHGEPGVGHWLARPTVPSEAGLVWRLAERGAEDRTAVDVVSPEAVGSAAPAVVRMAGWATGQIRAGSPSGLLLQRLAAAAARSGTTLWVPNVDAAALDLLLRLPGRIWVDGPAVPEDPQPPA